MNVNPNAAGAPDCGRPFPEELLSGAVDGMLTQAEDQRVRLHLEDCPACRTEVRRMTALRDAALSTPFALPPDDAWDERPKSAASLLSRSGGFTLLAAAVAVGAGFTVAVFGPGRWGLPAALAAAGGAGLLLLFLSALLDRLRALPRDRYRRIQK